MSQPRRQRRARPGAAAVAMVVLMVILSLIIIGMVQGGAGDQDAMIVRADTVQAFYAAEAGINMGIAELVNNVDADGDGTIGSISNDGNDANNPTIGSATVLVTRTDAGDTATLLAAGLENDCRRSAQCQARVGGGSDIVSGPSFEAGSVTVGPTSKTITLENTYANPVVVCTSQYLSNSAPIVVRVGNVTATSFNLWLQNPGDQITPLAETVWYIVMEAGSYNVGGVKYEAQKYSSTVTDGSGSWSGQEQSYLNNYEFPVVVGQVMSANDPDWSVFWCMGQNHNQSPHKSKLYTGKHVGEDPDTTRASETIGFIVFEQGHGAINGLPYDAFAAPNIFRGVGNSPPYSLPFDGTFSGAPSVLIASQGGQHDDDGSFAIVYGNPPANTAAAFIALDEDRLADSERSHSVENVAMIAFSPGSTVITSWSEVAPQ